MMPTNSASDNVTDAMVNLRPKDLTSPGAQSASDHKPIVVGLYGISGSGKTHLLTQLKEKLGTTQFAFYDGSEVIATAVPGGLEAFKKLEEQGKKYWRQRAINTIQANCSDSGQVAVVAGHFMFWSEEQETVTIVCTQSDLDVYTHILYLDISTDIVEQRRRNDTGKNRPSLSASHLRKWQQEEKTQLRNLCRHHGILFSLISPYQTEETFLEKVSTLLLDFKDHTEKHNLNQAMSRLDRVVAAGEGQLNTMLVMDADKTLATEDTGAIFWKKVSDWKPFEYEISTLKTLFAGPLQYTHTAFRQAVLLYEEATNDQEFEDLCEDVAAEVKMHPEFVSLLQLLEEEENIGAVVVTSVLRRVWDKVLEREGLSKKVEVIGGGRIGDGLVISAAVKGALVARLQEFHNIYVWAFGDSPLDLDMLHKADQAIIVVGEEQTRSTTMDKALTDAIDYHGLQADQTVLPSNASPRLDTTKLPLRKLTESVFVNSLLSGHSPRGGLHFLCATDKNAAKLLATPMRDAAVAGPHLREAHRRVGWYLAIEVLADVVDIEKCPIQHVLGRETRGYQLCHEKQTTIVALMRGGEPMALGVSDAFPLAMFVHAGDPENLKAHYLERQLTVILVDSVVNTGKTIIEFVERVRQLHATIRIVVVAGVVQAQCVSGDGLHQSLAGYGKIHLIALRISDTKFTGSGTTDTGNRLFNTTHLP